MVRNEVAIAAAHLLRLCVRRGWEGSFVRDRTELRQLPKLDVAGSIPVARSTKNPLYLKGTHREPHRSGTIGCPPPKVNRCTFGPICA